MIRVEAKMKKQSLTNKFLTWTASICAAAALSHSAARADEPKSCVYDNISSNLNTIVDFVKSGKKFQLDNSKRINLSKSQIDCYTFSTNDYAVTLTIKDGVLDAFTYQGHIPGKNYEATMTDIASTNGFAKGLDTYFTSLDQEPKEIRHNQRTINKEYLSVLERVVADLNK